MADAATAAEPDWLAKRRRKGASLAQSLELPTQKSKGWEFTDVAGLDLEALAPAGEGDISSERPLRPGSRQRLADRPL